MRPARWQTVVRHLHTLAGAARSDEPTDSELLERFTSQREESAFTALVKRHGPMVLGVCRRILGNAHDAEDAFQATFLVLIRKASSIRSGAALGGWLHEVALRLALRARARAADRRVHEQQVPHMPDKDFLAGVVWRDLQPVLDEEVQGLPVGCREAFVLCCLEGKTYEQAAQELGCRPGTISRRLARARELLRSRLARRGLVLPVGVLATALAEQAAPAAVPMRLISSTVRAALASAAGAAGAFPARVASLAEGGLHTMTATKTKVISALALAAGLLCAGAAALAYPRPAEPRPAPQEDARANAGEQPGAPKDRQQTGQPPAEAADQDGKGTTITGQVQDSEGKPMAGADVAVVGAVRHALRAGRRGAEPRVLAEGKTGADGHFRLSSPPLSGDRYWTVQLLAHGSGHGLGSGKIDPDAKKHNVTVRLPREVPLRGRLVDLQGQPAPDTSVQLLSARGTGGVSDWVHARYGDLDGRAYWPKKVVSDSQGRFTIRGLGAVKEVSLRAGGGRYALHHLTVEDPGAEKALALAPARVLEGTVTYGDTGKPVPHARLRILSQPARFELNPSYTTEARADADGRFRVVPHTGGYFNVAAYPPAGQPYLLVSREVSWPKADVVRQEVPLKMRRGVVVRGVVSEQPAGKPVKGATVQYEVPLNSPFYTRDIRPFMSDWHSLSVTGADGKFEIVTLPGPGHLMVNGPTPDYLHSEITTTKLMGPGVGPNRRYYPDGLVALDLKPDARTHEVAVTLRRGVTLKGQVVRPDGKPVSAGKLFCHTYIPADYTLNSVHALSMRDGRFELPGQDPNKPVAVFFYDPDGFGTVTELAPGKGEVTVRLQPCGSARARFVDEKGKPLAGMRVLVEMPVTPGPSFFDRQSMRDYTLIGDSAWMSAVDSKRPHDHQTDEQGRVTFPELIPGVRHRIIVQSEEAGMFALPQEFTTESGKALDLKEIAVKMPQ